MIDDEIIKIQRAVDQILASLKVASESYIGAPVARERMEKAASKAMGFPVRFPDWDEATATATRIEIEPPVKLDYIDVTVVLKSGDKEWWDEFLESEE